MIEDSAYLESVLDEKVDVWYNEGNDEISERTQYEEDPVYLSWKEFLFCLNLLILCGFPHNRRVHYNDFTTFEKVFRYDWNGR